MLLCFYVRCVQVCASPLPMRSTMNRALANARSCVCADETCLPVPVCRYHVCVCVYVCVQSEQGVITLQPTLEDMGLDLEAVRTHTHTHTHTHITHTHTEHTHTHTNTHTKTFIQTCHDGSLRFWVDSNCTRACVCVCVCLCVCVCVCVCMHRPVSVP